MGLAKESVLHSVPDRQPPKSFEKRNGLLGFSFSKGLSKGIVRKLVDLNSSCRFKSHLIHKTPPLCTFLSWTGYICHELTLLHLRLLLAMYSP